MKLLKLLSYLAAPAIVGLCWWLHVQNVQQKAQEELKGLRVVGYNFHVVDEETQKPPMTSVNIQRSLNAVSIPSGTFSLAAGTLLHITGRWAGNPPQKIQVQADGYYSQILTIGEFQDQPVKLELKRVGR
jgi:hypothetical protein